MLNLIPMLCYNLDATGKAFNNIIINFFFKCTTRNTVIGFSFYSLAKPVTAHIRLAYQKPIISSYQGPIGGHPIT